MLSHKAISQQKIQGQTLFQADNDQITACESPRGEYFTSCSQEHISCLRFPDWLSIIWNMSFCLCHELLAKVGSPAWHTTCPETIMEKFGFPDQHLLPQIILMKPLQLTKGELKEAFSLYLGHSLGGYGTHSLISADFPSQPVLIPLPPQPKSSYHTQVVLFHHASLLQGYVSITGCTSNPIPCFSLQPHISISISIYSFFPSFPTSLLKPRLWHSFHSTRLTLVITWATSNWGRNAER